MKYVINTKNDLKYYPFYYRKLVYVVCRNGVYLVGMNNLTLKCYMDENSAETEGSIFDSIEYDTDFEFEELLIAVASENEEESTINPIIASELEMLRKYMDGAKLWYGGPLSYYGLDEEKAARKEQDRQFCEWFKTEVESRTNNQYSFYCSLYDYPDTSVSLEEHYECYDFDFRLAFDYQLFRGIGHQLSDGRVRFVDFSKILEPNETQSTLTLDTSHTPGEFFKFERFETEDGSLKMSITNYISTEISTVIPPNKYEYFPVTRIAANAFRGSSFAEKIILPDSIEDLYYGAFFGMKNLKAVEFSSNIKEIPSACFQECTSLTELTLPDSIEIIESVSFAGCHALEHIHLGHAVTTIEKNAFQGCSSLTSIHLPASISRLAASAFPSGITLITDTFHEYIDEYVLSEQNNGNHIEYEVLDGTKPIRKTAEEIAEEQRILHEQEMQAKAAQIQEEQRKEVFLKKKTQYEQLVLSLSDKERRTLKITPVTPISDVINAILRCYSIMDKAYLEIIAKDDIFSNDNREEQLAILDLVADIEIVTDGSIDGVIVVGEEPVSLTEITLSPEDEQLLNSIKSLLSVMPLLGERLSLTISEKDDLDLVKQEVVNHLQRTGNVMQFSQLQAYFMQPNVQSNPLLQLELLRIFADIEVESVPMQNVEEILEEGSDAVLEEDADVIPEEATEIAPEEEDVITLEEEVVVTPEEEVVVAPEEEVVVTPEEDTVVVSVEEIEHFEEPVNIDKTEDVEEPAIDEATEVNDEPTVDEATEVSNEPAVDEATEVSDEPAVDEATEVTDEPMIYEQLEFFKELEVIEESEIVDAPENIEEFESIDNPDFLEEPDTNNEEIRCIFEHDLALNFAPISSVETTIGEQFFCGILLDKAVIFKDNSIYYTDNGYLIKEDLLLHTENHIELDEVKYQQLSHTLEAYVSDNRYFFENSKVLAYFLQQLKEFTYYDECINHLNQLFTLFDESLSCELVDETITFRKDDYPLKIADIITLISNIEH